MCMSVCICVCMYVCMCVCLFVYLSTGTSLPFCVHFLIEVDGCYQFLLVVY